MSFSALILKISILSIIVPLTAGFIFRKQLDNWSRSAFNLVLLATVPQLLTLFIHQTKILNVVYNIYTPFEFILVYIFIGNKFREKAIKGLSSAIVLIFFLLSSFFVVTHGIYDRFLNEWVCVANLSYLFWIFLYILENVLNEDAILNSQVPLFWYICGLIIYTPCTIFVFALSTYIEHSVNPFIHSLWTIHGIFNTVLYLCFAIGLYRNHANKSSLE